jgi:hypothetical protein
MSEYIKKGDTVNVYWEHLQAEFNLTVVSLPEVPGDWYGCRREDGTLVNIGTFCKMEKVKDVIRCT